MFAPNRHIFYFVRPRDSISSIANEVRGALTPQAIESVSKQLSELNPHLRYKDQLRPGETLLISSPYEKASVYEADLREFQTIWSRTSQSTKKTVLENFDILEFLSDRSDEMDFINSTGEQTRSVINTVPPFTISTRRTEWVQLSLLYERIYQVRNSTIEVFNRLKLSTIRTPVIIFTVRPNGLYGFASKLSRMIALAEKLNIGKGLFWLEIGLETAKTARAAVETRDWRETSKVGSIGLAKLAGGAAGTAAASEVCKMTLFYGVGGILVCIFSVGIGIWGGQKLGEMSVDNIYPKLEERFFPRLP